MKKVAKKHINIDSLKLVNLIRRATLDKKAEDVVALDVRGLCYYADYFVIMSGHSTRHVQGLAHAVDESLRGKRLNEGNTEGLAEGNWVLLDYDDVIVHIFYHETREFYDLEGLWHDAPRLSFAMEPEAVGEERS
ncbi:MAG: ribosome silencing factor [Deltaproteobacteria bacterium RIFOXYD12_FULL_50_9]|nr:MAG: ribosome silencing factor [Deltaproteobacteria bacterium RIFOXYD12_FULL_50_9]